MKKLLLLLITSFIALGTSAVGIQQADQKNGVVGWVTANTAPEKDDRPSVVRFVK